MKEWKECVIVRIETSTDVPQRQRYICSCGHDGAWTADGWRHGSNARWYTALKLLTWDWRMHAAGMARYHKPKRYMTPLAPQIEEHW